MRVIAKPEETESTLDALLATTFVIRVDRATLSVIAPLLSKCLKSRQSNMHRKAGMVRLGSAVFLFCVRFRLVRLSATCAERVAPFSIPTLPPFHPSLDQHAVLVFVDCF